MTKLEKLRDELAQKYDELEAEHLSDAEGIAFMKGWDARDAIAQDELAKLKEREARLVETLEVIAEREKFYFKDKDYYAEMNCLKLLAQEALENFCEWRREEK